MARKKSTAAPPAWPALTGKGKIALPDGCDTAHHRHGSYTSASIRRGVHKGHAIRIRTAYRIEIDGEPLQAHLAVGDDGRVTCHGLPNYSFGSALDLARTMIDVRALCAVERDELGGHKHGKDKSRGKRKRKGGTS